MMISSFPSQPQNNIRRTSANSAKEVAASQAGPEPTDQVQLGNVSSSAPAKEASSTSASPEVHRQEIPGSFIVVADSNSLAALSDNPSLQVEKVLGAAGDSTFLLIQSPEASLSSLEENSLFRQVLPNFQYQGDVFDEPVASDAPTDATPTPSGRPGHLDIINIEAAWQQTKGSPNVTSAITDTGVDTNHPVLQGTFWQNSKEIAGNGKDDDGNGYVDDTIGWDVTDNDSSPHDTGSHHHSHVHGIVHAQEGDSGATGVAPGAKGMALRIAGGKRGYSSAVVVESYLYAMNQGAKSINTSFNIDGFVGDKAIESTYRALGDNDVLLFNSAGNSGQKNPSRSVFEDIVLVAATDTASASVDKRSSFSNYGVGIDIAAPGKDIMSTLPNGRVGPLSGTSMASPVALGVDLLVQSAHPDWSRSQRWAQIAGTADNIDSKNPNEAGLFGGGRINAGRALTETVGAPTLSVQETKDAKGSTSKLTVHFDKVLEPAAANAEGAWSIVNAEGEVVQTGAPKEVRLLTNQIEFNVASLPAGSYELVASAEHLHDPFGQALDGNRDGVAGDNLVTKFTVG